MNDEARKVLAFIFKRSGKKNLPASDVYLAISMELQWCSPKEGKAFVKEAVRSELLSENDSGVTPTFDVEDIEIQTGFRPSENCFKDIDVQPKSTLSVVTNRIMKTNDISEGEIKQEIDRIVQNKQISSEVAAVFIAKKHDCKIDDLIVEVKSSHHKKIEHNGK